jgi:hypothetical protein
MLNTLKHTHRFGSENLEMLKLILKNMLFKPRQCSDEKSLLRPDSKTSMPLRRPALESSDEPTPGWMQKRKDKPTKECPMCTRSLRQIAMVEKKTA